MYDLPSCHRKQKCRQILRSYIDNLKEAEVEPKRTVTDEYLNKKLDNLSKEISSLFEKKLKEEKIEFIKNVSIKDWK